ncbi:DEAD/DEAH box helicase [Rhodocyclus purpureus]|uniref:DEAD/DEAH box helicase n=1 Tax=Rhodocyclus purpureus TaxID=1067 RepID=UPI0019113F48|nr:DEAD/DEAH box helicase [Rhodocyclus purpureus]MBK5913781.1 helicase [Rhodocyclus purpureus]
MSAAATVLRPYQERGIQAMREAMAGGCRRVLFYCPTGGGKTVVAEAMITRFVERHPSKRVLFIANRKQLVAQASAHLTRAGIEHGIMQGENTRFSGERVMVCSIDTIAMRGIPDDVALLIIDEAHAVAGSAKFKSLLFRYNAVPVVGLSATPFSAGLGQHYTELGGPLFERLVVGATIRELIDLGNLVDVECYAPSDPDLTGVKTQRGIGGELDFNERQLAEAVDKPSLVGDVVNHWLRLAKGKPTVVFACNIAHSQHLTAAFNAAGVPAAHIDYHHDDEERAAILDAFNRREIMVLSNSALLAEGWDAPHAECMILARPTKSLIRFIQMAGRVLRPFPGKEKALLLDHSGSVVRLGFPTDDLPLELDDGKPRQSGGKQERKKSEPKPCPKCKFVRPAGVHVCPSCEFAPQRQSDIEVEDGELVKLDRRKKPATKDAKQHVYSQLLFIEHQRKYRHGWAANQYRSIFEVWPRGLNEVTAPPTPEVLNKVKANQIAYAKRREANNARC